MFTDDELQSIIYLVSREAQEMRDGWQLAGINEAARLEALALKLKQLEAVKHD